MRQARLDQESAARDHRAGLRQLQRGDADLVSHGHRTDGTLLPTPQRPDHSGGFSRKRQSGLLAEPKAANVVVQILVARPVRPMLMAPILLDRASTSSIDSDA